MPSIEKARIRSRRHTGLEVRTSDALLYLIVYVGVLTAMRCAWATPTKLCAVNHLILEEGRPIRFVGDTLWAAAVRFSDAEMERYLDNARDIGMNLVGVFGTPGFGYDRGANAQGKTAFVNNGSP